MDINIIIILAALLFAIGGFVSSEVLLYTLWRSEEKKKSGFDPLSGRRLPESHGTCYDECMIESHWNPSQVSMCSSLCNV